MARIEKHTVVLSGKAEEYKDNLGRTPLVALVEAGILRQERHVYGYTWALVGEVEMIYHHADHKTWWVVEGVSALWKRENEPRQGRWQVFPVEDDRMTRILTARDQDSHPAMGISE